MSLALIAAALALPPAPPPVMTLPVPPYVDRSVTQRSSLPAVDFDVEVKADGRVLWAGPMRVSGAAPATFNRQKSDAPAGACAMPSYGTAVVRDSLTVSIYAQRYAADAARYQLTLNWSRPVSSDGCDGERNARTVGIAQSFDGGQRDVTVSGDGGLTVRIHRR